MKPSEYAQRVYDELDAGWTQGTLQNTLGNVCSVGAIARVAVQEQPVGLDAFTETCQTGNAVTAALEAKVRELGGVSVMSFNDHTVKQEVLNAVHKVITEFQERGE